MDADVWVPVLTFFLGQGSLVLLEWMRQRARDRQDRLVRQEQAARDQAIEEKRVLIALQEALELLRRVAANYLDLVLTGSAEDTSTLIMAYKKAEVLWSRVPSDEVRGAAMAAADACVAVGAADDRAELRALKNDLVYRYETGVTKANEAIGLRLREL